MQVAYSADDVRAVEAPLLAAGAPLMEHAAFALATRVLAELRAVRGTTRGARVMVLVGAGNNGGDGLHAAAVLARRGVATSVVTTTTKTHRGGLAVARAAGVSVLALGDVGVDGVTDLVGKADLLLDALVGIGGDGAGVRGDAGRLLDALCSVWAGCPPPGARRTLPGTRKSPPGARHRARSDVRRTRPVVVAVDVPSGTGVDDGTVAGTVLPADLTVTFGAVKPGLLLPPGDRAAGRVELVDIGLDLGGPEAPTAPAVRRLDDADVAALWPVPGAAAHKYTRGVLGLVAGTARYPGAAVLAAAGAVAAGVGMVRFVDEHDDTGPLAAAVLAARPEVVVGGGRVQAWAAGSGVDPADPARRDDLAAVLAAARAGTPAVLDAGALVGVEHLGPHVVLTPHAGELADLLTALGVTSLGTAVPGAAVPGAVVPGAVERRAAERSAVEQSAVEQGPVTPCVGTTRALVESAPLAAARAAHQVTGATVLLKGPTTVVVGPGIAFSQADAPAWLATAGAGDVLTGILGALLAGCAPQIADDPALPAALAAAAALVHGRAAHRANPGGPVSAAEVAAAVPEVVADLLAAP